ncbi:glycosyltransferase [Bacillus sp. NPDC077027]|uniref:glycosyltransferase n=1 Tax=Bacillus sp. NPDC077027 TaxID=3390548 RepID=UPI003D031672
MGRFQKQILFNQKKKTFAKKELAYYRAMLKNFEDQKDISKLDELLQAKPNFVVTQPSNSVTKEDIMTVEEKRSYLKYLKENHKKGFYESIQPQIELLPESNGTRYYQKHKVRIGIIADEFLYKSMEDAAEFVYIHPGNYKDEATKIDIFLLATAWKGLDGQWKGLGNPKIKKVRNEITDIIKLYKSKDIPILFYSKEDPVNYQQYIDLAKQADHIFTTCEEVVDDYKQDCPNAKTYNVLEFGVNPLYHNPIGTRINRRDDVLFAGSWYHKYPYRQEDTRELFEGVINAGKDLTIIDRNFKLKLTRHFYPKEYVPYVVESTDHETLQKIHKLYDFTLNLNSVKYSKTMYANRVYELQATGTIVISNYSIGINSKFPNIFLANTKEELTTYLNTLSKEEIYRIQMEGVRTVLRSETAFDRIQQMIETIGIHQNSNQSRNVLVVADKLNDRVIEMFNKQSYPHKALISESEISEEIYAKYDIIACFNDQYKYGQYYLEDMINAFKYTDSDYITKDAYERNGEFTDGIEHNFVEKLEDRFRTVFWSESFKWEDILVSSNAALKNGYSVDPLELSLTTNESANVECAEEYDLSVIIPVYNNGKHLLYKCFQSLQRSSIFKRMEIILVDDGSTDTVTPYIVQSLEERFDNVKAFLYPEGGSGSASRPRNRGLKLATAKWITYLDPDNEAITDGYRELLDSSRDEDHDMFIGNMLRLSDKKVMFSYYSTMMSFNQGRDTREAPHEGFLRDVSFKAMSIQALIVKRELIIDHDIQMIEGALGQDTLFFQQLLIYSKSFKVLDTPIHIYYAMVENSSVNRVNISFFEKYLLLEKARIAWLEKEDILDAYKETKLEVYVQNWYLKKLQSVRLEEKEDAGRILKEILNLYKPMKFQSEKIKQFLVNS